MGRNRKEAGKHKKATRRRRQEFARINDLYFEDRQSKDVTDMPDDYLTIALAATTTLLARRRTGGSSGNKDG